MKNTRATLVSLILAATAAAPALAAPETFVIDNKHTYPRFSHNHLGLSTQSVRFDKTSGNLVFDREGKTGRPISRST